MSHTTHRVLRFEFSPALIHAVTAFVGTHRYDDRKTYKEAWTAWLLTGDIAALLDAEHARLNNLGYTGDVADKLFKSARYYFRGKLQQQSQQQSQQQRRRQKYVTVNRTLLDAMDEHIERGINTPALGFADFCTTHAEDAVLQTEVASLFARYSDTNATSARATGDTQIMQEILHKLKKTYKNRYFMHNRTERVRIPFQNNNAAK